MKQKRATKLNPDEDAYWTECYSFYLNNLGQDELDADEYAYEECLKQFPRLREFKKFKV